MNHMKWRYSYGRQCYKNKYEKTDIWLPINSSGKPNEKYMSKIVEQANHWSIINPNRKIFEARKRETAALGAGEKLVLGHPLAATIGDSARCMQNLEKVLFTGPKTSDTVTFICD